MPDSDLPSRVRSHFHNQADACDQLGSPFTARLCRVLANILDDQSAVGRKVLGWAGDPRADALALRLSGGLHALVLSGVDAKVAKIYPPQTTDDLAMASAIPTTLARNVDHLLGMLDSAPQTNEIARSGMLLPGFLVIARESGLPLELTEIGASAGLNLLFDRFHYRYGENSWGAIGSPVQLAPDVKGLAPPLSGNCRSLTERVAIWRRSTFRTRRKGSSCGRTCGPTRRCGLSASMPRSASPSGRRQHW